MKKLNVKRLAAIGAGAVLLGAAATAAFTDLTKADIVNSSGAPIVNVVAGNNAAVSDFVWAGNIAARVAQLATKTMSVQQGSGGTAGTPTDMSVNLTVGGTTTVSGAKEFKDSYLDSTVGSSGAGQWEFGRATTVAGLTVSGRPIMLSHSQIPSLYEKQDTYKYNGSDTTVTIREYVGLNADVRMDSTTTSVFDLAMTVQGTNDFNYIINLGSGIPRYNLAGTTTDFTDSDDDSIRIPFFGKKYLVQQVQNSSGNISKIRLIEDSAKQTFKVGDTFNVTGKEGYAWAGKTLTVELTQVGTTGSGSYQAKFTLKDANNGTVIDTRTQTAGNFVEFQKDGSIIVKDTIYLDNVLATDTQNLANATVDLLIGAATVDLYNGKAYPYDPNNSTTSGLWTVTLSAGTGSDVNKLISITIGNSQKTWPMSSPIYPTESQWSVNNHTGTVVKLLDGTDAAQLGFAYLDFKGWEEKEATTKIAVGVLDAQNRPSVYYKDSQGAEHYIPFWVNLSSNDNGSQFVFDTKAIYYRTGGSGSTLRDLNFTLGADNNTLNGVPVNFKTGGGGDLNMSTDIGIGGDANFGWSVTLPVDVNNVSYACTRTAFGGTLNCSADYNVAFSLTQLSSPDTSTTYLGSSNSSIGKSWFLNDGNIGLPLGVTSKQPNRKAYRAYPVPLEGANSQTYNYALFVNSTTATRGGALWLLLDGSNAISGEYNKRWTILGTDMYEDGNISGPDPLYYMPDVQDFGNTASDYAFLVAGIAIDQNNTGSYDTNTYVNTGTDLLLAFPNNNITYYGADVSTDNTVTSQGPSFSLRDEAGYLKSGAWTDYGSKYTIGSGVFTALIPQNRRYLRVIVGGSSTSQQVSGGEPNPTPLKEGDSWTTSTGTKITVTDLNGTCGVGSGSCTPATFEQVMPLTSNLVYTDQSPPSGKVIIVGGYFVNSLAKNLTLGDGSTLQDKVKASGDYAAEKLSDGSIVVAGYTATDTGTAAQELINALSALMES